MRELSELQVRGLGTPTYDSPLADYLGTRETNEHYVDEDRVLYHDTFLS